MPVNKEQPSLSDTQAQLMRNRKKEQFVARPAPPPPSAELQAKCLAKAREYLALLQPSTYSPNRPSSLWITSFDNRPVNELIDEATYTTLPGKTTHKPAWPGSLAIKISFKTEEQALNAATLFRRNIKNYSKEIKDLLHFGTPTFGAWKFFELRTGYIHINKWEKIMNTPNLNDPTALERLIRNLCRWNQGSLWESDIQKVHFSYAKRNLNEATLVFKTGPMSFDFYKVMKKEGQAFLHVEGLDEAIPIVPLYSPYCCWGCYQFSHLKNECPNEDLWAPHIKNTKPYCDLCQSHGLTSLEHKPAMKGCHTFDTWATNLETESIYFQGGY